MKLRKVLILACLACVSTTALAAEWGPGLGPAKPYDALQELDLDKTMGYLVLAPRANQPASHFCGALQIFLPREDVALGAGALTLVDGDGAETVVNFSDETAVSLRAMDEAELTQLQWGGGTCIEIRLPASLTFGARYSVQMEAGCFTVADGVPSMAIDLPGAWEPALAGDYGVGSLRYISSYAVSSAEKAARAVMRAAQKAAADAGTPEEAERILAEAEQTVEPDSPGFYTITPQIGDTIAFELLLGGDAISAVIFSEDASVQFPEPEYTESVRVTGKVTGEIPSWSVAFLNAAGEVLETLRMP